MFTTHSVVAAIFLKPLVISKERLSRYLTYQQRRLLTLNMLSDMILAIRNAGLRHIGIVTGDPELEEIARRRRLMVIHEPEQRGVNHAAELAVEFAKRRNFKGVLLLPADIPFIQPTDIRNCLRIFSEGRVSVISPSLRYDGTNLMLIKPDLQFEFHYEHESFVGHVRATLASYNQVCVYYSPNIALDIDISDDIENALKIRYLTATTRFLKSVRLRRHRRICGEHCGDSI